VGGAVLILYVTLVGLGSKVGVGIHHGRYCGQLGIIVVRRSSLTVVDGTSPRYFVSHLDSPHWSAEGENQVTWGARNLIWK